VTKRSDRAPRLMHAASKGAWRLTGAQTKNDTNLRQVADDIV